MTRPSPFSWHQWLGAAATARSARRSAHARATRKAARLAHCKAHHLIVSPFFPGSTADVVARIVTQKLGESLHQTFVVDNKAGVGGSLGTAYAVAKASARRLHAGGRHERHARGQREPLQEPAVRPGQGLRTGVAGGLGAQHAGGRPGPRRQHAWPN